MAKGVGVGGLVLVWVLLCSCGQCEERESHPHNELGVRRMLVSVFVGALTGFASSLLFGFVVGCLVGYINRTPILEGPVVFSPKIPPNTLLGALAHTQLLNGTYFKALLDNGLTVAVKRLGPTPPEARRKAQHHLQTLAALTHANLLSLRAYINTENNGLCLVYDYVPTGSLEDAMASHLRLQLTWEIRLKIALGIVTGLHYLHFCCATPVLHYNLKPTNVMLDAEFQPSLTDFGLIDTPRYTDKSDVFSFGLILGYLLTGRKPDGGAEWLTSLMQGGDGREALDKTMVTGAHLQQDEMLMAVRIALVCLSHLPADRPSTDELVSMLTQLNSF